MTEDNKKDFKLKAEEIKPLVPEMGACVATDKIVVEGQKVGYMYREESNREADSGWRFTAGNEPNSYMKNPKNSGVYKVNTIANYDSAIIPYLDSPVGTALDRIDGTNTFEISGKNEIKLSQKLLIFFFGIFFVLIAGRQYFALLSGSIEQKNQLLKLYYLGLIFWAALISVLAYFF